MLHCKGTCCMCKGTAKGTVHVLRGGTAWDTLGDTNLRLMDIPKTHSSFLTRLHDTLDRRLGHADDDANFAE